jgi:hypothetical protein
MKIINTNTHPVSVLVSIHGKEDYVTVMPGGKVDLPPNYIVNPNWAASNPKVQTQGDK